MGWSLNNFKIQLLEPSLFIGSLLFLHLLCVSLFKGFKKLLITYHIVLLSYTKSVSHQ